jgi:hypothetical protein
MAYRDWLSDGDTFEHEGFTFRVNVMQDYNYDPPWEREEGHGPVSEWRSYRYSGRPDKCPGEVILVSEHFSARFYDFAETTRIAKRDGWGLGEEEMRKLEKELGRKPTRKQIVRRAVENDYEYLRRWCNDQWKYIGVVVTHIPDDAEPDDVETDYMHALWGIESDSYDCIKEVAHELADEACRELITERDEAGHWAARDVVTEEG